MAVPVVARRKVLTGAAGVVAAAGIGAATGLVFRRRDGLAVRHCQWTSAGAR